MKITKYVHACLLIETPERIGIIDPGVFSWGSGLFKVDSLTKLDDIIITHEHEDHMHLPFIQALLAKFPDAKIVTTESAAKQLLKAGISQATTTGNEFIEIFAANHETIEPLFPPPENIGVHYLNKLSHPGDSHHFASSKEILALPITAPWGTVARAAELGKELRPKYIVPIHDWHYNDKARLSIYDMLEGFFTKEGIHFVKAEDGVSFDIPL